MKNLSLAAFIVSLLGCTYPNPVKCHKDWDELRPIKVNLRDARKIEYPRLKMSTLHEIQECYVSHPYIGPQHEIRFGEIMAVSDEKVVILYIYGVSDIELGVVLDSHDNITKVGLISQNF